MSDDFLLNLAGISATMLGTFTVGVFFYLNSSLHHERGHGAAADRYMRSGTRWVFTAYSFPLLVPLVLVGAGPRWAAAAFASLADPTSRAYYDRKRAQGKRHNAALICLARRRTDVLFEPLPPALIESTPDDPGGDPGGVQEPA